jgi:hypothetical protein
MLARNLTQRVDLAIFMVHALINGDLIREAPAIEGRQTLPALTYTENIKTLPGNSSKGAWQ